MKLDPLHALCGVMLCLLPVPAHAQAVTWSDLEGVTVTADVHRDQRVRLRGRTAPVKMHQNWRITIGADKTLDLYLQTTSHGPRGTQKQKPNSGTFALNEPQKLRSRGGGESVWTFADGTLTFLRTFRSGAFRAHFAFARRGAALTCAVTESFARENGDRPIRLINPRGQEVILVSAKQLPSTCEVEKD